MFESLSCCFSGLLSSLPVFEDLRGSAIGAQNNKHQKQTKKFKKREKKIRPKDDPFLENLPSDLIGSNGFWFLYHISYPSFTFILTARHSHSQFGGGLGGLLSSAQIEEAIVDWGIQGWAETHFPVFHCCLHVSNLSPLYQTDNGHNAHMKRCVLS